MAPTIRGLKKEGIPYRGFVFMGLMNVSGEPYVIEYNVRLAGQTPRPKRSCHACAATCLILRSLPRTGTLSERHVDVDDRTAVTIVLASDGYPGKYEKGHPIASLELVRDAYVFQAGTVRSGEQLLTNGGRVMSVTGMGILLESAIPHQPIARRPSWPMKGSTCAMISGTMKKPTVRAGAVSR